MHARVARSRVDTSQFTVDPSNVSTFTMTAVHTFEAPGTVVLECDNPGGLPNGALAINNKLTRCRSRIS